MVKKSKGNKYDYDFQNDSILFYGEDNNYKSSIDLDGIIIDFSEEDYLMSIEILDASEKFKVSKYDLLNVKNFNAIIKVTPENIEVTMKMKLSNRNNLIASSLDALTINSMNIPSSTQGIAVSC
ncbi:MAG: DUF2283 domain-containing protein [ANME-2 cluster archaeon]|nr:DUF2283 domain-containing protein [ANME-2 cluster archaeon]